MPAQGPGAGPSPGVGHQHLGSHGAPPHSHLPVPLGRPASPAPRDPAWPIRALQAERCPLGEGTVTPWESSPCLQCVSVGQGPPAQRSEHQCRHPRLGPHRVLPGAHQLQGALRRQKRVPAFFKSRNVRILMMGSEKSQAGRHNPISRPPFPATTVGCLLHPFPDVLLCKTHTCQGRDGSLPYILHPTHALHRGNREHSSLCIQKTVVIVNGYVEFQVEIISFNQLSIVIGHSGFPGIVCLL